MNDVNDLDCGFLLNVSSKEFNGLWNGVQYTIKAGEYKAFPLWFCSFLKAKDQNSKDAEKSLEMFTLDQVKIEPLKPIKSVAPKAKAAKESKEPAAE